MYDDYNGWDTMTFTDRLEFYSDFNDYDVTVKVPANFVVWGTGTLRNAGEVLQPEILQRFQASLTSPTDDPRRDDRGHAREARHRAAADERLALHGERTSPT